MRLNVYFQQMTNGEPWDAARIEQRGRKLFELAKVIWPVPAPTGEVAPAEDEPAPTVETPVTMPAPGDYLSAQEATVREFSAIYEYLTRIAHEQRTAPYGIIARMAGLTTDTQMERNELGRILGDISMYEQQYGRPMLSAVTVFADEMTPGRGFFNLAQELGRLTPDMDELAFFVSELNATFAYWKDHA